ncbi:MAG: ketoacyl-ACP synthase III [Bacteroidales bacterium]|jgi:3-oxoacyl-[acyl-carrier-protein] synthase-3|nr:ketoacyl-ACP synthase III [Bacteroidales bacterium]
MDFTFFNNAITGMLAVMPNKEIRFEDEMINFNFTEKSSLKLAKTMGLKSRRIVEKDITSSDLCVYGINYLIEQGLLKKEEISAIIYISQTPDYIQPPTSNVIQGKLNLNYDVVCMDINQGCAGFVLGLFQSFCLMNVIKEGKIILLNAETPSLVMSLKDRSSTPLLGDAAAITIIEKTQIVEKTQIKVKNDGKRFDSLYIPAGGFRMRCSEKTRIEKLQPDGNYRSLENPTMKGDDVYNFTVNEVVGLLEEMIKDSDFNKEEIDYYMLHQPNQFILKQMTKKMNIPEEKMPNNIVGLFGNSSGAALPVNIIYNLGNLLEKKKLKIILSGFGIGLAWNAAALEMGNMKFCKMIGHPIL